jgi:succinate-acetate transporter protein
MAQEHSFASPGPAGLAALAVACFAFGAVFLGKVALEGLPLLSSWLVGGFIVQYTVAVMELKDHNITGGNVFLFFSAFFMAAAALSVFSKFMMIKFGMKPAVHIEGWMWMAGAAFLTVVTPAYAKSTSILFLAVILIDVALWCIVGLDSGWYGDPAVFKPIVAWTLIIAGWIGIYLAGAITCNTVYGKPVFIVPKPLVK